MQRIVNIAAHVVPCKGTDLKDKDATTDYAQRAQRVLDRWDSAQPGGAKVASTPRDPAPTESVSSRADRSGTSAEVGGDVVIEKPRAVPVLTRCAVLVVGGGPAGLSAAIAAARCGADTLLVERYGCFGGCISTVGMETLGWYRYEGTVESPTNIGLEMERLTARMGGSTKWPYNDSECLDADQFKVVADHLVRENGIRPLLHTMIVDVIMDGKTIRGVITESKSGRQAILAERVIDCTGDADVAHLAGARCRETKVGENMGVTSVFSAVGVDKAKFQEHTQKNTRTYEDWSKREGSWQQQTRGKEDKLASPWMASEFEQATKDGVIEGYRLKNEKTGIDTEFCGSWSAITSHGEATNLNLVHMSNCNPLDVKDLTNAEMEGRKQALQALKAMQATVPGFENTKLRNYSMTLGVRDTRKIIGRYNLTADDVLEQGRHADSIGIYPEFVDGYAILILPNSGRYMEVPYGICVSPDVENLLVAGRCVAGDRVSHAAMRNMMACTITGQGCGVAAAVSIREKTTTTEVAIEKVQQELQKQGVRLH